jgi:hypothetical protein
MPVTIAGCHDSLSHRKPNPSQSPTTCRHRARSRLVKSANTLRVDALNAIAEPSVAFQPAQLVLIP